MLTTLRHHIVLTWRNFLNSFKACPPYFRHCLHNDGWEGDLRAFPKGCREGKAYTAYKRHCCRCIFVEFSKKGEYKQ